MADILLTLCIPTYNRCNILEGTLASIFSDPDFHPDLIEVIVSDNCSTDNTSSVVAKYPYVKYFRNSWNTGPYNISIVLGYANGLYLKIINDTFSFKHCSIGFILNKIKLHSSSNVNLFFFPNFILKNCSLEISNINDFFLYCSFHTTWLASTGFWKKDYFPIYKDDPYSEMLFPQLNWMYSIVKNGQNTIVYFSDLFDICTPKGKGGYDFYKTFVLDYLSIVKTQNISFFVYKIEKYRLFRYHICPYTYLFLTNNKDFTFQSNNFVFTVFKKFWFEPYFYPLIFYFFLKSYVKKWFYFTQFIFCHFFFI